MDAAVKAYQNTTQKELRDRLVVENLDYVQHLLGRMLVSLPQSVDSDNLASAGILGLVEAAGQFDTTRGIDFRTFAYHRIRGAILDELRRNCPLSQHVLQQWSSIRHAWELLGENASPATLARHCGLTEAEVEDCIAAVRLTQPESWSEELSNWQRPDTAHSDLIDQLDAVDEQRLLANAIEQLPDRLRAILSMYYTDELRLAEIGEVLGLSESRVSRLLARAQMQLKGILERTRLRAG
ncbi:sigma-70 family RNA polymerase sigma factor [Planctomicrobium sp. SH664]|uniref:sigma-70 family RNA polymerase sigma factor n=1 Tax=Planctomicrobium sp. SH664 TaxID=3448125 RepID=UPI003F5BFD48